MIYVEHGALLTAVVYAFVTSCCYKIVYFFITTFFFRSLRKLIPLLVEAPSKTEENSTRKVGNYRVLRLQNFAGFFVFVGGGGAGVFTSHVLRKHLGIRHK